MKGIVFTEFLEMVEEKFGFEIADSIIEKSNLKSGGSYTSVGTYPHEEMVQLLTHLSEESGLQAADLLETFGLYLFGRFAELYGVFFENKTNSFDFLSGIENYIHVEVKKLYPDAQLPRIDAHKIDEKRMELTYYSTRKLASLAHGLMNGCFQHFKENISIEQKKLKPDGSEVLFILTIQ